MISNDFLPTEPGVYNISNEAYHKSEGISRTGIQEFKKSALHYWERYINPKGTPRKEKKCFEFGKAFHALLIEPDIFKKDYAVLPHIENTRNAAGQAAKALFEAQNAGKIMISADDYNAMQNMANRLYSDSVARALIENARYEISIYYMDEQSGLLCKSRPDILQPNFLVDLKTAANASCEAFERSMDDYGYHLQAGMMVDAVEQQLKTPIQEFINIPIEKEPPYAYGIYPMDLASIERGKLEYRSKLLELKECLANNVWPSYRSRVVSLPQYILNRAI